MGDRSDMFREARKAARRAPGSSGLSVNLLIYLGGIGILLYFVLGIVGTPEGGGEWAGFVAALVIGSLFALAAVQAIVIAVRMRRVWQRAERGDVRQVLEGVALPRWRSVHDRPVRTVVARVDRRYRYVRLAFARKADAAALADGQVGVELFDERAVRGPARLVQPHGTTWAFAVRVGDFTTKRALPDPAAQLGVAEVHALNALTDGWPDGSPDSGPGWLSDGGLGWPGDGGGADGGGGDGGGGDGAGGGDGGGAGI